MAGAIISAGSVTHCTPFKVVELVHRFFSGPPDLDPCDNERSIVGARRRIWLPSIADLRASLSPEEAAKVELANGLEIPWEGKVFVNPPYGKMLPRWYEKAGVERVSSEIVFLGPSYTSLKSWHEVVLPRAQAVCFVKGRLRFHEAKHHAHFASQIVYYGKRAHRFAQVFSEIGHTVWL